MEILKDHYAFDGNHSQIKVLNSNNHATNTIRYKYISCLDEAKFQTELLLKYLVYLMQ